MSRLELATTRDIDLLRSVLARDPYDAGYLLGDLDQPFFAHSRWFVASLRQRARGVLLLYEGLSVPVLLSHGAPDTVRALLAEFAPVLPSQCYAKIPLAHRSAFTAHYRLAQATPQWNMGLVEDDFEPADAQGLTFDSHPLEVMRLDPQGTCVDDLMHLYREYPGHFFEASQLASGVYYGAFAEGRLLTVGGTHVFSPAEQVAVLGNIVTTSRARGRGLARVTTSKLIEELYRLGCRYVSLQVGEENAAAVSCYRRLGFTFRSVVLQAELART